MQHAHERWFGPFRVDLDSQRLWHGADERSLRPKTFAVLRYLVEHPGRLVSKEELLEAIWPALAVSEAALTVCIGELRKALGDDAQQPRFIVTVHRRGYRFIGALGVSEPQDAEPAPSGQQPPAAVPATDSLLEAPRPAAPDLPPPGTACHHASPGDAEGPAIMVGREGALQRLQGWLAQAGRGKRQVGFVTGEPGIGKTMVVDAFVARAIAQGWLVAWGQCIEHYGAGEAYLPLLAALGQLCRAPGGARLPALLAQYAPTWLVQQGRFLHAGGIASWPNGTVSGCYRFRHAFYQQVVYEGLSAGRCMRLHRRIGSWEEAASGAQADDRAAELARHFLQGHDAPRAVHYLRRAADNALRRYAYQEAIGHLTRGLEVLATWPDTPERRRYELDFQTVLGPVLMVTKGYAALDVERAYERAWELCGQVEEPSQLVPVLWGLSLHYTVRGEPQKAQALGTQLFALAQRGSEPAALLQAHVAQELISYNLGEFEAARAHLEQGMRLYHLSRHHTRAVLHEYDLELASRRYGAVTLWALGYPDRAQQQSYAALTLAQQLAHPRVWPPPWSSSPDCIITAVSRTSPSGMLRPPSPCRRRRGLPSVWQPAPSCEAGPAPCRARWRRVSRSCPRA